MSLVLDHVSVQVPAVDAAIEMLRDRLGLVTTPSPAAPHRHGRVYLDYSYLEVAAGADEPLALFFLRFDQLGSTLDALKARGLRAHASLYEGLDGTWDNIEIDAGMATPLPILVRRTTPTEVAEGWPPPLAAPHPCGAEALAAVHLRVPRLGPAIAIYERLLGSPATALGPGGAVHRVSSGRIVLHEADDLAPAIIGIELRVASLGQTERCLSALGTKTWRAEGALWADHPGGWHLGLCEANTPLLQSSALPT
jgi:hypothetical protein